MSLDALILITICCWGIWGIFDKLALERACHRDVLLMLYLLYLPQVPLVWSLLNGLVPGWHLTAAVIGWTGLAAFTYSVAMVAYLTAMSKTEASYVLGITASYPLVLQLLAVALLKESLVLNRIVGAALIGLGVFAIGSSAAARAARLSRRDRAEMIACVALATLCWGIYGIFDKMAVSLAPPGVVYFAQCLWDILYLVLIAGIFKAQGHRFDLTSAPAWKFSALSTLCLTIGAWTYLTALAKSTASYVIVITACYPLLMYLFALLFLKEKFNRVRLSGIALVVVGGILVQLTQQL